MSPLSSPPVSDPTAQPYEQAASLALPPTYPLSQLLIFLQQLLQEYEMTEPDWRSSQSDVNMMADVLSKLAAAEASQTNPIFNEAESLWLQEMLITYQETHADTSNTYYWRRIDAFNLMLYAESQVETNFAPAAPLVPPPQGESTNSGMTPPIEDPYNTPGSTIV
jgi:hypothetical protein